MHGESYNTLMSGEGHLRADETEQFDEIYYDKTFESRN